MSQRGLSPLPWSDSLLPGAHNKLIPGQIKGELGEVSHTRVGKSGDPRTERWKTKHTRESSARQGLARVCSNGKHGTYSLCFPHILRSFSCHMAIFRKYQKVVWDRNNRNVFCTCQYSCKTELARVKVSLHWSNPSLKVFPGWRWTTDQSTDKAVMDEGVTHIMNKVTQPNQR